MRQFAIYLVCFFVLSSFNVFAQEKFTISGFVKDGQSGESVIGANLSLLSNNKGVSSNQYGYYSLTYQ